MLPTLPTGLTAVETTAAYLHELMVFILSDMERKMSEKIRSEDVQWCLSVPAMWEEGAKSAMRTAAELAGMVQGPRGTGAGASPHDLVIVLEPEAAALFSFYHITSSQIN